ncbi:glycoside hydrolase family 108 protein [Microvirga antarctica]|uniref:glycoside hydrolase family 108 protein n=1 Tax=Microvirga antarctica TaxID=2819233 RepID=UPI001B31615B|nr:glycoside hydrolase family 108 protein [Microvirga antarctica]
MTTTGFAGAMKVVLAYEGGRAHHPADPGGRTNQGVTQRVYDGYRDRQKKERRSVYNANAIEISEIYRLQYWQKIRGDALPSGIDVVVFDGAVNSGPVQSAKWLQRALGTVPVDGMIGEVTLSAVEAHPDHDQLIAGILERRLAFLAALRTWPIFGRGWSNRVEHLRNVGQALASGTVPPPLEYFVGGEAKATIADARGPASTTLAAGASGGGGCAALLSTAQAKLEPFVGTSVWVERVVAALAITGVILMLGGAAYAWWIGRQNAKLGQALDLRPSPVPA